MNAISKTPSAWAVERAMAQAKPVLDALRDEAGTDTELLADVLDGETDVLDVARALVRVSLEAAAFEDACAERIKALQERKARFARRHESARMTAFAMLDELGLPGLSDAEFTVSKRPGKPAVLITDVDALPDCFVKIERKPIKSDIATWLATGAGVRGAELTNAQPVWSVRTK